MTRNVIVGQSGGPTAVINSTLCGVYETAKALGAKIVYGMVHGIEGLINGEYINMSDYLKTEEDLELLKRTPSAYLGSCRYKLPRMSDSPQVFKDIFETLKKLDIGYFFYIGGNDSMDTIDQLSRYARETDSSIKFIGVPKTVDNDLVLIDHTPGFGSAAKFIATATKEVIRDNRVNDIDAVTIIEVMGRDAGWLTGSTAICRGDDSDGPDFIYLPEIPFDIDEFLESISKKQKEKRSIVVAVSEGIKTKDGKYVCDYSSSSRGIDAFGHKQLTGTARVLGDIVAEKTNNKVRAIEFSSLQRCAAHIMSKTDMEEAYLVGKAAVEAANDGYTGKFVSIKRLGNDPYGVTTELVDVSAVANLKKDVPRNWINEEGNYVTDEFIEYVLPLIQGEVEQFYYRGTPKHIPSFDPSKQ
ncbi:MAG: 6-phosphofructokinase [Ruminococcaceae bacterium]|mgnify:CR=1 FL=1|nr:6-phosphofructokinase [Oscillospiraceae bacterium]